MSRLRYPIVQGMVRARLIDKIVEIPVSSMTFRSLFDIQHMSVAALIMFVQPNRIGIGENEEWEHDVLVAEARNIIDLEEYPVLFEESPMARDMETWHGVDLED